jgi:hypothetical protein
MTEEHSEVRTLTAESVCDHCGRPEAFNVLCPECEQLVCNECGRVHCCCAGPCPCERCRVLS